MALLIALTCGAGLAVRPWIPPASIWLTQVAITDHIDDASRSPTQKLTVITTAQLHAGIYAYTAIHAPRGLHERIYHQWILNGRKLDKIPLDISGGNADGYRSWSHKMNFPEQALGNWQIQVVTEGQQVLGVLRFKVGDSVTPIESIPVPATHQSSAAATKQPVEEKEPAASEASSEAAPVEK